MNTLTHALLPVIFYRIWSRRSGENRKREWITIAVAGALPDLLNPHLTLAARMASWSHGLPFWLGFSLGLWLVVKVRPQWILPRLAPVISGAYLFHMLCDAISGGVNFGYPFRNWTWGDYWVDPTWWIPLDIFCVLACYLIFRAWPAFRRDWKSKLPGAR